jgi:hypothetical protein
MSQHRLRTTHPKHGRIDLLAGWDRPLQGYFLTIELIDAPDGPDGETPFLYTNLGDDNLPLGMADSFDYFAPILARLDITLPAAMIADIKADGAANMGNKERNWEAA